MTFFHLVNEPNGFLSNWYKSKFEIEGKEFNCVEQYMMWSKAMLFEDLEIAEKILHEFNPSKIKALGREVRNYEDSVWASKRYDVVKEGVKAKFSQNEELKKMLLATDGEFAECAVHDRIWGIGLGMKDPCRFSRSKWRGKNLLGLALQEVYLELRQGR